MLKSIRRCFTLTSLAAVLALCLIPTASAGTIAVRMNEPFEVNGQVFQSGTLTLHEVSDYSPVATLNEVCVGRECLGVFLAQELQGSSAATQNELVFGRALDGHLVLEGVAFTGSPSRALYGFEKETSEWRSVRESSARGALVAEGR